MPLGAARMSKNYNLFVGVSKDDQKKMKDDVKSEMKQHKAELKQKERDLKAEERQKEKDLKAQGKKAPNGSAPALSPTRANVRSVAQFDLVLHLF